MSDTEGSGGNTSEPVGTSEENLELPGISGSDPAGNSGLQSTAPEGQRDPQGKKPAGKVAMLNNRKMGCVFPRPDMRVNPGETYHVSEKIAKVMELIPGQIRK